MWRRSAHRGLHPRRGRRGGAGSGELPHPGVDVDEVLLDQPGMRAITGAGDDLTIIPTMDGTSPVDVDSLADEVPPQCRFVFAETATFGSDIEQFHKTTFQDPPEERSDLRGRRRLSRCRNRSAHV